MGFDAHWAPPFRPLWLGRYLTTGRAYRVGEHADPVALLPPLRPWSSPAPIPPAAATPLAWRRRLGWRIHAVLPNGPPGRQNLVTLPGRSDQDFTKRKRVFEIRSPRESSPSRRLPLRLREAKEGIERMRHVIAALTRKHEARSERLNHSIDELRDGSRMENPPALGLDLMAFQKDVRQQQHTEQSRVAQLSILSHERIDCDKDATELSEPCFRSGEDRMHLG